jgi:hypothetical protein
MKAHIMFLQHEGSFLSVATWDLETQEKRKTLSIDQ